MITFETKFTCFQKVKYRKIYPSGNITTQIGYIVGYCYKYHKSMRCPRLSYYICEESDWKDFENGFDCALDQIKERDILRVLE
jgi:hypothetical protein